jgi:hypothetical protein
MTTDPRLPTTAVLSSPEAVVAPSDSEDPERFTRAITAIDAANAGDPNVIVIDGDPYPKELAHARLATAWVRYFDPGATEAQLLAARAHHLRRWTSPRDAYPRDRAGYLRWRAALKKRHAEEVGDILRSAGYGQETVDRVGQLVRKEGLAHDAQVQAHEDALCLVFVQTQLQDLTEQLGDDRIVPIVQKTMKKMSQPALDAVGMVALSPTATDVIGRAAS